MEELAYFSIKIHWSTRLAASDVFHMFTQSTINVYRCLKNVIHQIDSKNEWLLLSVTFTAKLGLVFVLTFENAFSKKLSVWEIFSTLTLIQIFWKTKTFFKKLEYHFLVETRSKKDWKHHFHSKLLCQKPMFKEIEWRLQNRPIIKSGVLLVTALFFLQNLFQF